MTDKRDNAARSPAGRPAAVETPPASTANGWTRFLPGLAAFRGYKRKWLMPDLLAGATVCVVMIPSVIAYADLMGLPPQRGLYAALVPLLIYPLFGSSRQVIVGPDIAISLMILGAVGPLAGGDGGRAATLAALTAVLTGLLLLLGARGHVGAVADFFSKPVLVGYMTGAALILMGSQFDKLFRIPLEHNDFFPRLFELARKIDQTHGPTLLMGLCLVALILVLRRLVPKIPSSLVTVLIAMAISYALRLPGHGVKVVGPIPTGLPRWAPPAADWRDIHTLLPAAIGIALLNYTQTVLLARALAAKHGYEVKPNRELAALGLCDLCNGLFQGFSVTGSQSRTAINDDAGGKTQAAGIFAALALMVFLLFLTQLIAQLPTVALAAILICGGWTLVEFNAMKRIYRFYPRGAAVAVLTTLGVLAAGVGPGILIGVALSLLGLINRLSHPPDAILTEVAGRGFHDLGNTSAAETVPGLIAYRFYAPLLFSNVGYFVSRVRHLVAASPRGLKCFLIDAQAITDIDVTAVEALHGLHAELKKHGVGLMIAHANRPLRDILERTGLAREIRPDSFFASVHECVDAFKASAAR